MTTAPSSAGSEATAFLRALQVLSLLTVANLAWQFVTAGQLFPGPDGLHAAGAIVLHVVSGATLVAAAGHWYSTRRAVWPTVVAFLVFAYGFVQAATGDRMTLAVHIPGAMGLVVGAVAVAVWSFGRTPSL